MALKVKTAETKVVLVNLLICIVVFYTMYYVVLSVCFAVFRIKMLDGLAPFDFKTNPSWINPYYLVLVISLEITFFICGLLFALVVEEWVWDYAVTVTIIHIIVTSVEPSGIGSAGHGGSFQQLLNGGIFVAPPLPKTRPSKTKTPYQRDNLWCVAPAENFRQLCLFGPQRYVGSLPGKRCPCRVKLRTVMSEFPLMLHWWLALGSGVISMICGGQILAYYLFKDNFIYPILDDF